MTALVADALACRRGGRTVFEGVSFALEPGEAMTLEGANGSGKSSLLRMLAGLLRPAGGRLDNPFRVAWMGHDDALKADRTLIGELRFWGRIDGIDNAEGALERFALTALADLPVRLLSSGQRRRLALARVWQSAAPLWLLDEPATGLDAASLATLAAAMAEHRARGGLIVAATHQTLGLDHGRVLRLDTETPRREGVVAL
jgi:heme exporter protein A